MYLRLKNNPYLMFKGYISDLAEKLVERQRELEVEVWYYGFLPSLFKGVLIHNGVKYRFFQPSPLLPRAFRITIRRALQKYIFRDLPYMPLHLILKLFTCIVFHRQGASKLIIHVHGYRDILTYLLLAFKRLKGGFVLIIQDHGVLPSKSRLIRYVESKMLPLASQIYAGSKWRELVLRRGGLSNVKVLTMGVDIDKFKPLNKILCRRKLGLPEHKVLALYVGRRYDIKGLPLIISTINKLKRGGFDVDLVVVGGSREEPLNRLIEGHVKYHFFAVPRDAMPYFYNACDFFVWFVDEAKWRGIGVSCIEALACGKPAISNTLIHLPQENVSMAGLIPNKPEDLERCIKEVIAKSFSFNPRRVAEKHFNWRKIIDQILTDYFSLT